MCALYDGCSVWRVLHMTCALYDGCSVWHVLHMMCAPYDGCSIWRVLCMMDVPYGVCSVWCVLHMNVCSVWWVLRLTCAPYDECKPKLVLPGHVCWPFTALEVWGRLEKAPPVTLTPGRTPLFAVGDKSAWKSLSFVVWTFGLCCTKWVSWGPRCTLGAAETAGWQQDALSALCFRWDRVTLALFRQRCVLLWHWPFVSADRGAHSVEFLILRCLCSKNNLISLINKSIFSS